MILHLTCSVFRQHCDISSFLHSSRFSFHPYCPVIDQKHGLKSPWSGQSCLSSRHLPHPCILVNERLVLLSSERASFCEASLSSSGLAENSGASYTQDHRLCVTEHGSDLITAWAFDIHKIRVGTLYETLLLVSSLLLLWRRVQQILRELKMMRW